MGFFIGCLIDFAYPRIGTAVQKMLMHLDVDMITPPEQTCCGFPAHHAGLPEVAARLARRNIAAFEQAGVDRIVTACPTCAEALRLLYPRLLAEDPQWASRARTLGEKVKDFASFAWACQEKLTGAGEGWTCTYHDSCHLKRSLGVTDEPRQLLAAAGAVIVEAEPAATYCSFRGSYSLDLPEVSRAVLGRRLLPLTDTGAPVVALDCPGCLIQISGGLENAGSPVTVRHTAETIADRIVK